MTERKCEFVRKGHRLKQFNIDYVNEWQLILVTFLCSALLFDNHDTLCTSRNQLVMSQTRQINLLWRHIKKTWIGHLFIETHWALSCLDNSIWRKRKNWNCSHLLNFIEKVSVFSKLLCHCHLTSEKYIWPLYKNVLNWT